jgi:hypothetical protein
MFCGNLTVPIILLVSVFYAPFNFDIHESIDSPPKYPETENSFHNNDMISSASTYTHQVPDQGPTIDGKTCRLQTSMELMIADYDDDL